MYPRGRVEILSPSVPGEDEAAGHGQLFIAHFLIGPPRDGHLLGEGNRSNKRDQNHFGCFPGRVGGSMS